MVRRGGMRRWVRWGGVALTVALPLVWGASLFGYLDWYRNTHERSYCIAAGVFATWITPESHSPEPTGWFSGWWGAPQFIQATLVPSIHLAGPKSELELPLWIPWLAAACFTAWRFRADRLKLPHACTSCGYDKTGLDAAAVCPECGASVPSK